MEKSYKTCRYGILDGKIYDGIRCAAADGEGDFLNCVINSNYSYLSWQPKEEDEAVKSELNTKIEELKELQKAILNFDPCSVCIHIGYHDGFCKHCSIIGLVNFEHKLVKVSFAEAFKAYMKSPCIVIKSCVTNYTYCVTGIEHHGIGCVKDEEIDGDWMVLE